MAIPSVTQFSNQPGGGLVTALGGINALRNAISEAEYNKIKAQYAPTTLQAEAASKLAYANLMGPQYIAKIMTNPSFLGNTKDEQLKMLRDLVSRAAIGQSAGNSLLQQGFNMQQPSPVNTFSGHLMQALKSLLPGQKQPQNALSFQGVTPQQESYNYPSVQSNPALSAPSNVPNRPKGAVKIVGEQWYDENGDPVYEEDVEEREPTDVGVQGTRSGSRPGSYAENTGRYQGTVKQGEKSGEFRAEDLRDLGHEQKALSHSGASLKSMASIIKNPVFQNMRSKIPFFQDKQLNYLMKKGTEEEKKLIGKFITTSENIVASGVQAFAGKPLVREFDLMQRQKITPNDPVHVAEGKLQASIALHDIMEEKQKIIKNLLKQGVDEADAVEQANKMVDVSAIEKRTEELLRDKPTKEDIAYMAKKHGISTEEVKRRLKAQGKL
jgi:hypothetical protein